MDALTDLGHRYVAVWNEPDPAVRHELVRDLWAPGGGQILADPPDDVRTAIERLRFTMPTVAVHGHDALEVRIARAYEMFVAAGEFRFAPSGATRLLANVVAVTWELVSTADGSCTSRGVNVLDLDAEGRIRADHLFIER